MTAHDGAEYVPAEMLEQWEKRDPLMVYGERLVESGTAGREQLAQIDSECRSRVDQAIATVEAWPMPDPTTLSDGVYA